MAKLTNEIQNLQNKPRLQILLCLEIAQAYLIYGRVQKVEEYLGRARDISGLKLELTGEFKLTFTPRQNTLWLSFIIISSVLMSG